MDKHTQAYNGGREDMSIPVLGTLDLLPKYDGHKTTRTTGKPGNRKQNGNGKWELLVIR